MTARATTTRKTLVGRVDAEILRFTVGKDDRLDLRLAEFDCLGTAAHVTTLSHLKGHAPLTRAEARAVIAELVAVIRDARAGRFTIEDADQDIHLAVERRLSRRLGEVGRRVHTGRSRNDQVAVDLRLFARAELLDLLDDLAALARVLVCAGRRHRTVPMVGRTHMQPGMPSSLGVWFTAYAESLLEDAELVRGAYALNNRSPLGSAAGYGVPLDLDRALTARLLGFERPVHNVMYASHTRGKVELAILNALGQIMLTLSRLSEDLIVFAAPEFGYFRLPDAYTTGSSIMPQKRNPDVLELTRARAAKVLGCAQTIAVTLKGLPGGYNRDLQETKEAFMEGLQTTRDCVRILGRLMAAIEPDPAALRRGFRPDVFAADRALELVSEGMPFRDAYQYVKEHLDELHQADPDAALARKRHAGAPAGLDFEGYDRAVAALAAFATDARRGVNTALSRLLGARYPELTARTAGSRA